ncbi:ABC transporter ATP-binding protein [Salinisphaera sp. RV14]|uniref:ABC transporter ATP-binding protein n=1 Tax=Salinisphaera sp. RV14 TaxID=3454140 RepID=UPI003F843952
MSNDAPVLEVRGLGKAYRDYGGEWRRVLSWFGFGFKPIAEQWTLQNVDFEIPPGEAVGIVGQNGAGKSTLLKIITGTLRASTGEAVARGRIAAILELGMGFHADLTGRQNVYHSAGLMGFSREQVDAVIGDIEAFAEIGGYFDEPVRTYSSGMQMRVAFAVATAYRPEVLIIDEALSVGDTYFQHKSFARIREFQAEGTSLLIVSHDRTAIQTLCTRALLLAEGRVIKDGQPEAVMDFYNALIAEKEESSTIEVTETESGRVQTRSGTGEARVESVTLCDAAGKAVEHLRVGEPVALRVACRAHVDLERLVLGYVIKDRLGQPMFGINTHHLGASLTDVSAGECFGYTFRFPANLGVGSYSVAVALHAFDTHVAANYDWWDLAAVFDVVNVNRPVFTGAMWLPPEWECERG